MFDLFRSRQKAVRYFLGAILMIIAVSMVITLIPGYGTSANNSSADPVVAEIGSQKLTTMEVARQAQRILRGNQIPPEMMQTYVPQFVDSMIQQIAVNYEFERLGLAATDDEVLAALQSEYSQFFQNGVLAKDQLQAVLAQQGMTLQDAIDLAHQQVILDKVQNIEYSVTVVSPKEVDDELSRKYERAKIRYIAFPPAKFRDQVRLTPEEIKAFFDMHRMQYSVPEKRSFQVLVIDQEKVAQSVQVTDAQLHAAYSASMDNFRVPERVHARHILIKTVDKNDAEKKQLLAKAEGILKQIKSGSDFAELAKKESEDTGTAPKGGDLDWFVKGQMVPEFEKVAFSLKPKEISDIVTTTYGYHIIQVLEHEQAHVKPFDEVKAALAEDLKKQGLNEKMQALGEQVHAALAKSPSSASEIAKQFNIDLITVPKAAAGEAIPTLGVSPEIDGALNGMKDNDVSPVLVLPANRLAIAVLNDKIAPHTSELAEVETKVRDRLLDDKSLQLATDKAKEAAEKLKKGEDFDKLAKSMKLDVTDSILFSHADSIEGLGGAVYFEDAFKQPLGTVIGPANVMGRSVVYKITDQQKVYPSKLVAERQTILEQLKRRKAQANNALFMDSIVSRLVADGKVKINRDAIKRLEASFR
jgi:peptidyl-prolyl cis-trans isomerase D